MNITLLALFASTFSLIDADIDVTKRGINMQAAQEGNPLAALYTSRGAWGELTLTAYAANTAAFFGIGALGKICAGDDLSLAWRVLYITFLSIAEIYALSMWQNGAGLPVYVRCTPLYVIW